MIVTILYRNRMAPPLKLLILLISFRSERRLPKSHREKAIPLSRSLLPPKSSTSTFPESFKSHGRGGQSQRPFLPPKYPPKKRGMLPEGSKNFNLGN